MRHRHIDTDNYVSSDKPAISVIIRAYNAEGTIKDAIESILKQSYDGFIEIVICYDKGSNDRTYEIIKEYAERVNRNFSNRKIVIVEHEHTTPFLALLEGFKKARGGLITVLDADNVFPRNYVEHVINYVIKTKTDKAFYYTNLVVTDEHLRPKTIINRGEVPFDKLLVRNLTDMNTMIISSSCLKELIEFLEPLSKIRYFEFLYEDYLLSLLALKMCNAEHIPRVYVIYREHGKNITGITYKDPTRLLFSIERSIKTLIAFYYLAGRFLSIRQKIILFASLTYRILLMLYTIIQIFLKQI